MPIFFHSYKKFFNLLQGLNIFTTDVWDFWQFYGEILVLWVQKRANKNEVKEKKVKVVRTVKKEKVVRKYKEKEKVIKR